MRMVLQGEEVTVTIKADRQLTTKEIIAAHQLSTGDFEALFISTETDECDENNISRGNPSKYDRNTEYETSGTPEWVQVEMDCPECSYSGRVHTKFGNVFTKCPKCKAPLHNKAATGVYGEHDKAGNYYYANERIRPRNGELTPDEKKLLKEMGGEN